MEKVWLKRYPPQVPADINPDEFRSWSKCSIQSCCRSVGANAFINMGCGTTWRRTGTMSRAFAAWLQQEWPRKGERVAIMLPNLLHIRWRCSVRCAPDWWWSTSIRCIPHANWNTSLGLWSQSILILANFAHLLAEGRRWTVRTAIVTEIGDRCRSGRPRWSIWWPGASKMVPYHALPNTVGFNDA